MVVTSAVTEADGAVAETATSTFAVNGLPAGKGQVTPTSVQTSLVTEETVNAPSFMSNFSLAPVLISTFGVAFTLIVRVEPGTTGDSEKSTDVTPRLSTFPEHYKERRGWRDE